VTRYLLDTNHLSAALSPRSPLRARIVEEHRAGNRVGTCVPVLCEVEAGIEGSARPQQNRAILTHLLRVVRLWPLDAAASRAYGELFWELRGAGVVLSQVDIMLAALALQMGAVVVTRDSDFAAVPELRRQNWL